MALETAALTLLAFPQLWDADAGTLRLRFLCVPLRGPLTALAAGLPNFADANLSFEARLIGSLDHVPRAADVIASRPLQPRSAAVAEGCAVRRAGTADRHRPRGFARPRCDVAALPQGRDAELSRRRRQPRAQSVSGRGRRVRLRVARSARQPAASAGGAEVEPALGPGAGTRLAPTAAGRRAGADGRGGDHPGRRPVRARRLAVCRARCRQRRGRRRGCRGVVCGTHPATRAEPAAVCRGAVPDRQGEPRARRHRARCAALRPWPCPDGAWRAGRRRRHAGTSQAGRCQARRHWRRDPPRMGRRAGGRMAEPPGQHRHRRADRHRGLSRRRALRRRRRRLAVAAAPAQRRGPCASARW